MKRTAAVFAALLAGVPAAAHTQAAQRPWWSHNTVCYEVFVRSFYDSDGDGIGDLNGLTEKLDYINDGDAASRRDLGANCIWLMPIAESPSYHGYDVVDYYRVERDYGTNDDFKRLVAEAHRRGIRVLVDLVLNHSSSDHPYFKQALIDPNSPYRLWYGLSPTKPEGRGPWGQEIWHRSYNRDEYYFGLFVREMPDLDYRNPAVRREAQNIARYWLQDMGVDGFRLDAVAHLTEDGPVMKNAPSVHPVLREFAAYVRQVAPNSFTVGEVMDSTGSLPAYYPDQLDSHFAFDAADALINAARSGSARALFPAIMRLQRDIPAQRFSPFLRNHDQTRAMTDLRGDFAKGRVAATLMLTMPGIPFMYYGEEIGITGDKPDPRLRTPMQWTTGPSAGFTRGLPWEPLQPDSLTANVQVQDADAASLLNHYRALVHLRTSSLALGAGELVPLTASTDAVAAYLRRDGARVALVLVNLGATPAAGVTISSADRVLPAGRYAPATLLGGATAAALRVGADGRIRGWIPVPTLAPMSSHILDLTPGR
ncbi:alpha-amylase family glycosyl hydrolase [Longimicrobium terrae]|uniref:Alpha-amylase n=1 Tax=Longimicrobium terrae TaxID=1639882 RepID=A0A841H7W8_9BACT|nr:alpha-amylase family glycosyl hydrolase [Longimicrobium terrae]MBB4639605.1 glycosidase [Longimicrobium terrae]MBB6073992.1 glycosidase [Longimicrobium terrae]NNC28312.1 alpha-amylase [Longimicrobium terrae]